MIKTLIFSVDKDVVVVLVRGDHEINPEKLTQTLGGKHNELATPEIIEKVTGAKVGFAGPMGLADKVSKLIIDHSVAAMAIGVTGANKTDYHIKNIVPGRDFPLEGSNIVAADIRNAIEGDTHNGKKLLFKHGIEVGQVFKLGTKYSSKLKCNFLDDAGKENPCLMGCYGIGIHRLIATIVETNHDEKGIIWPKQVAPFDIHLIQVENNPKVRKAAEGIYRDLQNKGIEVLYDDRAKSAGEKFAEADLIGLPVRIIVSERTLKNNCAEVKKRNKKEAKMIKIKDLAKFLC
jgi:prolyl-tRNA synthetase